MTNLIICIHLFFAPCELIQEPPEPPGMTEEEFRDKCERACGRG